MGDAAARRGRRISRPPIAPTILKRVLGDPPSAKLVRSDIAHEIRRRGGADNIIVYDYTDKSLYGKSLAEIARLWKLDPVETAIRIQMEGLAESRRRRAHARLLDGGDRHGDTSPSRPWVATSTDGGIALPEDGPSTHARFYGSFTRKIRHYAIDRGAITLEHAIRSSTSLPARIMGLNDRGQIREGRPPTSWSSTSRRFATRRRSSSRTSIPKASTTSSSTASPSWTAAS